MGSNRLFEHDRRVAINAARSTFAGWHDRLLATALILVALAAARAWALDRSWPVAAWTGLGAGIVGLIVGRRLAARLVFHGFDGVLAADALQPITRGPYAAAWHLTALAILAVTALIARPALLIVTLPGYLIGAVAASAIGGITLSASAAGTLAAGHRWRAWIRRPLAGPIAGALLIVSMPLLARSAAGDVSIILLGVETTIFALVLTSIDDAIVRAMTMAGWTAWRIVAHHARGAALFAGIATPIGSLTFGTAGALVVVAVVGGALVLMTMRVLTYRLYARRAADLIVSILAAVLMLVGATMTIALPVIALVVLWHLHRRASGATWLIA